MQTAHVIPGLQDRPRHSLRHHRTNQSPADTPSRPPMPAWPRRNARGGDRIEEVVEPKVDLPDGGSCWPVTNRDDANGRMAFAKNARYPPPAGGGGLEEARAVLGEVIRPSDDSSVGRDRAEPRQPSGCHGVEHWVATPRRGRTGNRISASLRVLRPLPGSKQRVVTPTFVGGWQAFSKTHRFPLAAT